MTKTVRLLSPRAVVVVDEDEKPLGPGEVREFRTLFLGYLDGHGDVSLPWYQPLPWTRSGIPPPGRSPLGLSARNAQPDRQRLVKRCSASAPARSITR